MNIPVNKYKEILRISMPVSIALTIPFLNLTINNYFLSSLGELQLGIAGITGVYYLLLMMLGNGLHGAIQTIIARRTGENNNEAIGKTFGQGMIISLSFSFILMILTYYCLPPLLSLVLRNGQVQNMALEYLNIRIAGLPFLFMFQLANSFFMGTTNTKFLVLGTVVQAGLNIILDYAFIFGNWGFPVLGFKGAAIASALAELAGMMVIYIVIFKKRFHIQFRLFSFIKYQPPIFKLISRMSLPLMGQYAISIFTWLVFYMLIEHIGERALAISNLMRNLFAFNGIFIWAFASAANTMVSLYIGQKRQSEVIDLIKRITELSLSLVLLFFIFINIYPRFFLEIFGLSTSFIDAGIPVLRIVSLGIIFQSVSAIWLNGLTGTGKTRINLIVEFAAIIFYLIYVYLVIEVYQLNLVWAWASEILYWLIILVISYYYITSKRWMNYSI